MLLDFFLSPLDGEGAIIRRAERRMIGEGGSLTSRVEENPPPGSLRSPTSPARGEVIFGLAGAHGFSFSRRAYRIRGLLHATPRKSPSNRLPILAHDLFRKPQPHFSGSCEKEGGGAPKGAHAFLPCPAGPGARHAGECCHPSALRARSPFGAPPRRLPRKSMPWLSPGRVSWDMPRTGVTRRALSQSSGAPRGPVMVPAEAMPGPPGSGLRDRPREPHLLHLLGRTRTVPFDEQALTSAK